MTVQQPGLTALAKQGDLNAIATLMNRSLQPKGIVAKVAHQNGHLRVLLEGQMVPEQTVLALYIRKGILAWQIPGPLRDCQDGTDAGDAIFAPRIKRRRLWSMAVRQRWDTLAESTRYQSLCRLDRYLEAVLALSPTQTEARRRHNRDRDLREHLFLFLEDTAIPPTHNASEQALRLSVLFRKLTHGLRSDWGRALFADVRSIVKTGKRQGLSAFQALAAAWNPAQALCSLS